MIIIWIVLIVVSTLGVFLGMFYFYKPEAVVARRARKMGLTMDDNDPEFRAWMNREFEGQVERTRKMGKVITIFESIWLLIILILFFESFKG